MKTQKDYEDFYDQNEGELAGTAAFFLFWIAMLMIATVGYTIFRLLQSVV